MRKPRKRDLFPPGLFISLLACRFLLTASTSPAAPSGEVLLKTPAEAQPLSTNLLVDSNRSAGAGLSDKTFSEAIELRWIPPGTFEMGSPESELGRQPMERRKTPVTISEGFWMGKYEVTLLQYESLLGPAPSVRANRESSGLNKPVSAISWEDATNFCRLLTDAERDNGRLPAGYAYRLPTEAEWEYACRAGTTTRFSFGDDFDNDALASNCWYKVNSSQTTHTVGTRPPNPWGLYDMHGNVAEWCLDTYSDPSGQVSDPLRGDYHVFRGGSWNSRGSKCRAAARFCGISAERIIEAGFRVVLAHLEP